MNRELVVRFQHLVDTFDEIMPKLAQPVPTLRRIAHFAERYGTRQQFFNSCAANPQFFRVLALLFDRSTFTYELLGAHPEIAEEVLRPEVLRKRKDAAALAGGARRRPAGDGLADWLWLYVKAEQVRYAIGELLGLPEHRGGGGQPLAAGRRRAGARAAAARSRGKDCCWWRWENMAAPS